MKGAFVQPLFNIKAISVTYSECLFVALGIRPAMRMRPSAMWPVQVYNIFPRYLTNGTIFENKKLLNTKYRVIHTRLLNNQDRQHKRT
jgi:hypothetical protein